MTLETAPYLEQREGWPPRGRHILAQYDESRIVVYQAYRPSIARFAAENGFFGGEFSLGRMSWIKPNFLWMMYRSGWAQKEGQEHVLAVWLLRDAFEGILEQAVHTTFDPELYATEQEWKRALARSPVRVQWDPDHEPSGRREARRAIQLGLSGPVLERYAREWIVGLEDITPFVREQREHVRTGNLEHLTTPRETVYPVSAALAARLQTDPPQDPTGERTPSS